MLIPAGLAPGSGSIVTVDWARSAACNGMAATAAVRMAARRRAWVNRIGPSYSFRNSVGTADVNALSLTLPAAPRAADDSKRKMAGRACPLHAGVEIEDLGQSDRPWPKSHV